jgi:LacI family transcriptional regulator
MAGNDLNALTTIRLVRDLGYLVPEEVAVVGVDDTEILCDLAPVQLSSVNCNFEQQGYEAAALLERLMNGGAAPAEPIIISPRGVTWRRSTDTLAIPDLDTAKALRFLRDHHSEPIAIKNVRAELTGSLRHVQGVFRKHVGRTMAEELTRLRVTHAKELLADPKMKIDSIALASGFASRFHFIRSFQRVMAQSPSAYRRSLGSM